jgi:hypothetical protein
MGLFSRKKSNNVPAMAARSQPTRGAKNATRSLSVDFGAHTLKLAEVEWGPLGPIVKTFGVSPYLRNKNEQADLVGTLEQLLANARATSRSVILHVPETDAFLMRHEETLPNEPLHNDQLVQRQHALHSSLDKRLTQKNAVWPLTPGITRSETGAMQATYPFLVVPRALVDFYHEVLKSAGLELAGLQHLPTQHGNVLGESGRTALLDIGAESTGWYVYDHGKLIQRNTLPYGGEALTKALTLAHGWEREKAEEHKRSLAGESSTWPEITRVVTETYLNQWWQDLTQHLAEQPAYVDRVVLTGGGSRLLPLREFLFARLGLLPEAWRLPHTAHVAENLRPHIEPQLPVLANSLALLIY